MSPLLLRHLWSLIEATQTSTLLNLDDANLVQWLLRQVESQRSLNHQETDLLSHYIHSKLSLIRDLAQERRTAPYF
jgi:polynucleotide 5'-kinase involved in rRNA processing